MLDDTPWVCPICHTPNVDNFADTLWPLCERCGAEWRWEQVVGADTLLVLNVQLAVLEPEPTCPCAACQAVRAALPV